MSCGILGASSINASRPPLQRCRRRRSRPHAAARRCRLSRLFLFFFFQAEDGIRDWSATGVQTCALPISFGSLIVRLLSKQEAEWDEQYGNQRRRDRQILVASKSCAESPSVYVLGPEIEPLGHDDHREIGRASCRERE